MPTSYKPIKRVSATRQIAEQIRHSILSGELKAEERLPGEHDLADQFNVSRPTIREALKRLAAQNLVQSRRGPTGGTFVKRPSERDARVQLETTMTLLVTLGEFDLHDIAEARQALETLCGRMAATRRTDEHLERMAAEIRTQLQPGISDEEFCASDVRFHRALVDAAANPVLQFLMTAVIEALQPVENLIIHRYSNRSRITEHHKLIFSAIRDGDGHGAGVAISGQMAYLRQQFDAARRDRAKSAG